jgi:hypothetical protein
MGLSLVLVGCTAAGAGRLDVTVTGLPTGVVGAVTLVGPVDASVTSTTTLDLPAGTYAVTVGAVSRSEMIALTVFDGSASATVTVRPGSTSTLDVAYARRPGTGRAWLPHGSGVAAYDVVTWNVSGTASPAVVLASPDGAASSWATVVSPRGDLYVAYAGMIARYAVADLDTPGASPVGTAPVPGSPRSLAWSDGRLYVMRSDLRVIHRFDAPEAIVGGALSGADASLAFDGTSGCGPSAALAFDDLGRLWLPVCGDLVRLDSPHLPVGPATVEPDHKVPAPIGSQYALLYHEGSLYTSGCVYPNVLFRYDDVDAASGVVATVIDLSLTGTCLGSIALDAAGRFWITNSSGARRYSDVLATASGASTTVTPLVVVQHGLSGTIGATFSVVAPP